MLSDSVSIRFSGLTFRFSFPERIQLPEGFAALACSDPGQADEEFEIRLLSEPLSPKTVPVCTQTGICLYRTQEGWLRIYTPLTAEDGCQVACFLRFNGRHTLYYPRSKWPLYANPLRCAHLLGGEALLLRHDAFLLHSSVVMHKDRMVLFSGPSGAGKSTQAQLWNRYLDAKIVNGDRCVIRKTESGFWGGGSIWCGSSGIYQPDYAPIAGIFLVNQSPFNSIEPLGADAFFPLFTQTIINSWDGEFVSKVTGLITDLIEQTPVYRLNCRPDEDAVRLVHNAVFMR